MSANEDRPLRARMRDALHRYFRPRLVEVAVPWNAFVVCALWYFISYAIVAGVLSSLPKDLAISALLATGIHNVLLFLGTCGILWWFGPDLAETLGLHREVPRACLLGVLQGLLWFPGIFAINAAVSLFAPDRPEHPALTALKSADAVAMLALWGTVVVAAPLWEELLYRGIVQTGYFSLIQRNAAPAQPQVDPVWNSWLSVFVAAILFGGAHWSQWPDPIPLAILGLGLGLSFAYTHSLWTPIVFHATFNGVMLVLARLAT